LIFHFRFDIFSIFIIITFIDWFSPFSFSSLIFHCRLLFHFPFSCAILLFSRHYFMPLPSPLSIFIDAIHAISISIIFRRQMFTPPLLIFSLLPYFLFFLHYWHY
jgi:hypothetical protein